MWLEDNYDHKFLIWENDPMAEALKELDPDGVVFVPYNPTAENIAKHMVEVIAVETLKGTGCRLIKCSIDETRKCSAAYEIESI